MDASGPHYFYIGNEPRTPDVETLIREQLKDRGLTASYVFESVDIFRHTDRHECDYLLLIPGCALVLLEVKTHTAGIQINSKGNVTVPYGKPQTAKNVTEQIRQTQAAAYAWLETLKVDAPWKRRPSVVSFLVTPRFRFSAAELGRANNKHRTVHAGNLSRMLDEVLKYAQPDDGISVDGIPMSQRHDFVPLTDADVQYLARIARGAPDVKSWVKESVRRHDLFEVGERLSEELLRATVPNSCVLVEGAAGTGKTRLAIGTWRAWTAEGRRAALVLSNHTATARARVHLQGPSARARSVTHWGNLISDLWPERSPSAQTQHRDSWKQLEATLKTVTSHLRPKDKFDAFIIDDTHHVPMPILELIRDSLTKAGRLLLFSDSFQIVDDGVRDTSWAPARLQLQRNLRSTKQISRAVAAQVGLSSGKFAELGSAGPVPRFEVVSSQDLVKSATAIAKHVCTTRGWAASDVAALSLSSSPQAMETVRKPAVLGTLEDKGTAWHSVEEFRGRDAPVVVLILDAPSHGQELDELEQMDLERLVYLGLSRARDELYVVASPESRYLLEPAFSAKTFEPYDVSLLVTDVGPSRHSLFKV